MKNDTCIDSYDIDDYTAGWGNRRGTIAMRGSILLFITATLTLFLSAPSAVTSAEVAFLPLGPSIEEVLEVSADGSTFVGTLSGSTEAFIGKIGEELTPLGTELSVRGTIGTAISGDGTVAAGIISDAYPDRSAFSWSSTSQMVRIDGGNGVTLDNVGGLSFHGDVIVGGMKIPSIPGRYAYRWTEATGAVSLGDLPGGNSDSEARDVSDDGLVVVGNSGVDRGYAPFRWTASEGMVQLPGSGATAIAISPDGSAIVGSSRRHLAEGQRDEAAVWNVEGDLRLLGVLPAGRWSQATDASLGGKVIVGVSVAADRYTDAFRWTEQAGMKSLATLLSNGGVDLIGWRLHSVRAVSNDGTVFVGRATNPSGRREEFVAKLPVDFVPEPSSFALVVGAVLYWGVVRRQLYCDSNL